MDWRRTSKEFRGFSLTTGNFAICPTLIRRTILRRERIAGVPDDAGAAQIFRLGPGGRGADGRGGGGCPRSLSPPLWCRTFRRGVAAGTLGDRAAATAGRAAGVTGAVLL